MEAPDERETMSSATLIREHPLDPVQRSARRAGLTDSDLVFTAMLPAMSRETERALLRQEQAELRTEQANVEASKLRLRVAELEAELKRAHEFHRDSRQLAIFGILRKITDGLGWAVVVAALYLPLSAVEPLARHFAGTNTQAEAGLRISIAFSAIVCLGWAVTGAQSRLRKRKIKAQRVRLNELERELDLKKLPPPPKASN